MSFFWVTQLSFGELSSTVPSFLHLTGHSLLQGKLGNVVFSSGSIAAFDISAVCY